jgi:hypothetical protein
VVPLGRNDHQLDDRLQRFPDQFLVREPSIDFGSPSSPSALGA